MYAFGGVTGTEIFNLAQYTSNRTGVLNMVLTSFQNRTNINDPATWSSAGPKYFINIDLSGTNAITTERK